jgi:hypothetical protein
MPIKSFAKRMPKDLRAELDRRIMDGRLSTNAIWEWLRAEGVATSRSAVGRHMQHVEEAASEMRKAREMAGVFAQKLGPDIAEGSVGSALVEVVQSIMFKQMMPKLAASAAAGPDGEAAAADSAEDMMFLARAVQSLIGAQKSDTDRILKIRKETAVKAAEAAVGEAKSRGLSADTVAAIRAKVLGVAA